MATVNKALIPAKLAENVQTTQYTATGVTALIDKFTATNVSAAVATITVNLVTSGGAAGASNTITKTKSLAVNEVYTFPELIGQVLGSGDFISTLASAASAITIRASGREVT